MKLANLKRRLRPDRPQSAITIRMPADVVADLKRIAPALGFSGYQPLIKAYVGHGLRRDLERLEKGTSIEPLLQSLRAHGVSERVLATALEDAKLTKRSA